MYLNIVCFQSVIYNNLKKLYIIRDSEKIKNHDYYTCKKY